MSGGAPVQEGERDERRAPGAGGSRVLRCAQNEQDAGSTCFLVEERRSSSRSVFSFSSAHGFARAWEDMRRWQSMNSETHGGTRAACERVLSAACILWHGPPACLYAMGGVCDQQEAGKLIYSPASICDVLSSRTAGVDADDWRRRSMHGPLLLLPFVWFLLQHECVRLGSLQQMGDAASDR